MLKKLLPFVGKYWKALLLCPLLMVGEVLMEVLIPLRMADIVDIGIANADLSYVIRTGIPSMASADDGVQAMKMIDALYESGRTGTSVKL